MLPDEHSAENTDRQTELESPRVRKNPKLEPFSCENKSQSSELHYKTNLHLNNRVFCVIIRVRGDYSLAIGLNQFGWAEKLPGHTEPTLFG
jgi:hypothetical protein